MKLFIVASIFVAAVFGKSVPVTQTVEISQTGEISSIVSSPIVSMVINDHHGQAVSIEQASVPVAPAPAPAVEKPVAPEPEVPAIAPPSPGLVIGPGFEVEGQKPSPSFPSLPTLPSLPSLPSFPSLPIFNPPMPAFVEEEKPGAVIVANPVLPGESPVISSPVLVDQPANVDAAVMEDTQKPVVNNFFFYVLNFFTGQDSSSPITSLPGFTRVSKFFSG